MGNACYEPVRLEHADFLLRLPALASLSLSFYYGIDTPRVMAALQTCTQLTELALSGFDGFNFTSEQLASCLQHMPRMQKLDLRHCIALSSLSFLAVGTLPSTLTCLCIGDTDRDIPFDDLEFTHQLCALRSLTLNECTFDDEIGTLMRKLHTPPSRLIPSLQRFTYILWEETPQQSEEEEDYADPDDESAEEEEEEEEGEGEEAQHGAAAGEEEG